MVKGKFIKIIDIGMNKCYIGSTTQPLSVRMAAHRKYYKHYFKKRHHYMSVYSLFDEFGVENCKIVWIEVCPCNSKKELVAVEGKHIRDNDCVNRYIAGRTNYDYWQEHKEYLDNKKKEYRTKNAEIIKQKKSAKVVCSCGSSVSNCHVSRQLQTKKHQQYLQNRSNPQEQ